jgi:PAS domain S-box-containing protein
VYDVEGNPVGAVTMARAITDRVQAEKSYRHAEEGLRKLFRDGPLGMVMIETDLRITEVNDTFCRMVGYTQQELLGKTITDLTHPDDQEESILLALRLFSKDTSGHRCEMRYITRDGRTVWLSMTTTAALDGAGAPAYALGIAEEISDRKRVEAAILQQNQRLSADLEASLAELKQSRARILALADQERRRIERDLHDGAQQRLVALRVRLGLVGDILDANPGSGAEVLSELGRDVDAALDEVRSLARGVYPSLLADRGLEEALRAAARRCPLAATVRADGIRRHAEEVETAVYFACMEAMQNAAKHAGGARGVVLTLSENGGLRFEVSDDGAGFSIADMRSGQGLLNMRDRLEAVGGTLTVESSAGHGTTVTGVVPVR